MTGSFFQVGRQRENSWFIRFSLAERDIAALKSLEEEIASTGPDEDGSRILTP